MAKHPDLSHPADCFGCKAASIGFTFTHGRQAFHGDHPDGRTDKERFDNMVAQAGGRENVEPVGDRWV